MPTSNTTFAAPWGTLLKGMTAFSAVILLGIPALCWVLTEHKEIPILALWAMVGLPLAIFVGGAFFMIRGYELAPGKLLIHRLGWKSEVDLHGLESVEVDPEAMRGSFRTFGNGGLFCFAGRFRNKKLGSYRAFATDLRRAVVLRFEGRVIVVTPGEPVEFKAQVERCTISLSDHQFQEG